MMFLKLFCFRKFYFVYILLFVTVMTFQYAMGFVHNVEDGMHRFVIGDTLRVVALYDAAKLVGGFHSLFFSNLIVMDDIQDKATTDKREISSSVKNLSLTLMIPLLPTFVEG